MAKEYIERDDVYKLFDASGTAHLHVSDIDVIPVASVTTVTFCRECAHHGRCAAESIYLSEGIAEPFCCRGEPKEGDGNG